MVDLKRFCFPMQEWTNLYPMYTYVLHFLIEGTTYRSILILVCSKKPLRYEKRGWTLKFRFLNSITKLLKISEFSFIDFFVFLQNINFFRSKFAFDLLIAFWTHLTVKFFPRLQ